MDGDAGDGDAVVHDGFYGDVARHLVAAYEELAIA